MNIISLFLLGIGASVAFANDASNNDKTQRLYQYFPSIQAFEEYVMTTCLPTGTRCLNHHHCCSTYCLKQSGQYNYNTDLEFFCADPDEVSEAELADIISTEKSETPASFAFEDYAKEQSDNQAFDEENASYYDDYWLFDDDYYATVVGTKVNFARDQESVQDTEDASYYDGPSSGGLCKTTGVNCYTDSPYLCCSGICNPTSDGRYLVYLGQCA